MANGVIQVTLDLGATPVDTFTQALTGLTGISANADVEPFFMAMDTTSLGNGHTEDEHLTIAPFCSLQVPRSSINAGAGTGTLVFMSTMGKLMGKWNISIPWNG